MCVRVCVRVFAAVLSAWWGLWAEALVVQKSGSSSVLGEGKPESCGKTLLFEWLVRQLLLYMLHPAVNLPLDVYFRVICGVTAKELHSLMNII